jgi:hypothetical protein
MNPTLVLSTAPSAWPECVTVNWRRLSSGLWRVPEGDIHATYSAESFPRVTVFTDEGRLFTSCGIHYHGPVHAKADCYPLIPLDEYRGPEPRQYTYAGREVAYRSQVFRLGPKVAFKASDPTVEEWRTLFRVLYADGGMFAARRTYLEFLDQTFSPKSDNEQAARLNELAEWRARPTRGTQDEMRRFLEREANPAGVGGDPKQIDLAL